MQRSASSSRASDDFFVNISLSQLKHSPRKKMDDIDELPLYDPSSDAGKKEISRSRWLKKLVHGIPLILLICAFTLWWFSYPAVNVVVDAGRITEVKRIVVLALNKTPVNHTITGSAPQPDNFVPQKLSEYNEAKPPG